MKKSTKLTLNGISNTSPTSSGLPRASKHLSNDANLNLSNQDDLSDLMQALLATPEARAILAKHTPNHMEDLIGEKGLISQMLRPVMQELLEAEMTEHLGYPKYDSSGYLTGNNRNGSYLRQFKSSDGQFALDVPRDRRGQFQPKVITA